MAERGFPSLSAKQLVRSASTFLSAFCLLPRLEEVHIPWIRTPAAKLRKKLVYQLAGWAGKWNAVPLALNNKALDPFSKDLSLSVGYLLVLAWLPVRVTKRTLNIGVYFGSTGHRLSTVGANATCKCSRCWSCSWCCRWCRCGERRLYCSLQW